MATRIFGPSKGNRRPTQVAPSKTPVTRPTAQKGGGGNKAAGSVEPTAANTPTVSVSPSGEVSTEHFAPSGPSPAAVRAKREAHAAAAEARRSRQRVRKVRSYVRTRDKELTPKREVKVDKGFLDKAASPKPVTVAAHTRKVPGSEAPRAKPIKVAEHQRSLPEQKQLTESVDKYNAQQVKRVKQRVHKAQKIVDKTSGLTGPITPDQKVFAEQVAKETGLSARVIAAQALAEESGSAATSREAEGNNDWLNIGYNDSGPNTAITGDPAFSDTKAAAKATSEFFKNENWGPSTSIAAVVPSTAGKSDQAQIEAIGNSDWATSGSYRESIEGTHKLIGETHNPKAEAKLAAALKEAKGLGIKIGGQPVQTQGVKVPYKAFGRHVQKDLHAVVKSKGFNDENSPNAITLHGPGGATLVRNVQESSGVAAVINKNQEPEIAARLLLLSAKTGKTIYINSAARTPEQSEHVGGYPDDPHTEGKAMDIGVDGSTIESANSISEAEYESVGLYRPFGTARGGSSSEDNHVQLLNEGSPATGSDYIEGSTALSVPGVSGISSEAITSYSESSGEVPAQVAAKVKANKKFGKHVEETYFQKLRKRVKRLQGLGVDVALPGGERPSEKQAAGETKGANPLHQQLAALEKKYSIGAV